jgi:hypothetical protein
MVLIECFVEQQTARFKRVSHRGEEFAIQIAEASDYLKCGFREGPIIKICDQPPYPNALRSCNPLADLKRRQTAVK